MNTFNFQCGCGKSMDTEIFYANTEIYFGKAECDCGNVVKFQQVEDDLPTRLEGSE